MGGGEGWCLPKVEECEPRPSLTSNWTRVPRGFSSDKLLQVQSAKKFAVILTFRHEDKRARFKALLTFATLNDITKPLCPYVCSCEDVDITTQGKD